MPKARVLITSVFLHPGDEVDMTLRAAGIETIHRPWDGSRAEDDLIELLQGVDGAIVAGDRFTARVLGAAHQLKVISRTGVGYDAIDVPAATSRGIVVCNTPEVNREAVADFTMMLVLLCARRVAANLAVVRAGSWERVEGRDLADSTLGIVGLGSIGRAVAQRAAAFGMRLLAHDLVEDSSFAATHGVTYTSLARLLGESDYVSLHVFLSEQSRHLIDARRLALMKPTAFLINTARGPVVDEAALHEALKEGHIAGAALDVFEREPLPADSPLRHLDNVYLFPHAAGVTSDARRRSGTTAANNVIRILLGQPAHNVRNPEVLAARDMDRAPR